MILKKSITEICHIIGGNPSPKENEFGVNGVPFVKMKDLGKYHLTNNLLKVENRVPSTYQNFKSLRTIPKGSILLPRSGSVGLNHRAILGMDAFIVSHICALSVIDDKVVDNVYLYYYLTSIDMVNITKKTTGLDAITFEDLGKIQIPLPPLETQKRIAAILDKADELRQNDKKILEKYDQLAQSVFLEMFGDPVRNKKRFEFCTIRDLVSEVKYGTSAKASDLGSYPYLRMNNITYSGYLDLSDLKYIDIKESDKPKYLVKEGDILFNRTNSKELVGKTGIYNLNQEMAVAGYLIRVRVNSYANPYYIWGYLNSLHGKMTLNNMCKNIVGMANINAQEFQDIVILKPPIELQNKYSEIIKHIGKQKETSNISLRKSEDLFQSLLQRVFRGEL
jgi:type I restriction enzyme S subunit